MIFHEIDVNPSQAQSLGVFLNYYLPTTEKLLDAYVSLDEKQASGKNANQTRGVGWALQKVVAHMYIDVNIWG